MSNETPSLQPTADQPKPTATLAVVFAWLVVGLPTAWGVFNSIRQAMHLFH